MLHAYYNFNVCFFTIFVCHIFLNKFGLKIWISPNWLKFGTGVHYYMLIMILMFIFFKRFVIHIILGKFGPKIWCYPNWVEPSICVHYQYYKLVIIENSNFSKCSHSKYSRQILFQLVFSKLTELHCDMLITNLIFLYLQFFSALIFLVCNYINNMYLFQKLNIFLSFKECKSDWRNHRIVKWTSQTRT